MRKIVPTLSAVALSSACALAAFGTAIAATPTDSTAASPANRHAQFQQRFFNKLDTNHDGVVSRAEYQAWVDGRFAKLDTNGDGSIDATEIESSPATAARVQRRAEHFIKRYDKSGTGNVSESEFETKEMTHFDRLSGGADTMTETQFAAAMAAHRHHPAPAGQAMNPASDGPGE